MEILKVKYKLRCDLGACKNLATHAIKSKRTGLRSEIHVCDACMRELYTHLGTALVPAAVPNAILKASKKSTVKELAHE